MSGAGTKLSLALSFLFGGAVLYLAIPMTVANAIMWPQDRLLASIKASEPPDLTPRKLDPIISSRERALNWVENGQIFADLGFLRLLIAIRNADKQVAAQHSLQQANQSYEQSLARAPVNPHGWTQLAYTMYLSDDPSPKEITQALQMSLLTGPYEPMLVFPRLRLLLRFSEQLSPYEQETITRQIRFAWEIDRRKLVQVVTPLDLKRTNMVRIALARSPKSLLSFERRIEWARGQAKKNAKPETRADP